LVLNLLVKCSLNYLSDLFFRKKERRSHSLNRKFFADYIGLDEKPGTICFTKNTINMAQTIFGQLCRIRQKHIYKQSLTVLEKYYLKGLTYFSFKVDLCKSREMRVGQNVE